MELRLTNRTAEARRLHEGLDRFLSGYPVAPKTRLAIELAMEELFANLVDHGFPDGLEHVIVMRCAVRDDALHIQVEDDGIPFDLTLSPDPDLSLPMDERPIGGLGVFMIRRSMDELRYERRDGMNVLHLVKRLR